MNALRCNAPVRRLVSVVATLGIAASAHAADLTVEVLNPRSTQGTVGATLFSAAAGWLKTDQAVQATQQPSASKVTLVFRNVPPGRYALSVMHDENGNGKLDTNLIGIPTERYGFSRDAASRMGPPSFDDAAFDLQADTALTVNLR
jgi:uncharacterized protein (DUF2141 family)